MIQTFKENPRPNFAHQILGNIGKGIGSFGEEFLQQKLNQRQQQGENESLKRLLGPDFSGISPEMKKTFVQEMLKQRTQEAHQAQRLAEREEVQQERVRSHNTQQAMKMAEKQQAKLVPMNAALRRIERMEEIGERGNLGLGSHIKGVFSSKTREDRAEYERLGKSLISMASNIPIRNQREFETLAHDLYNPSLTDATRKGILNAMKEIIQSSIDEQNGEMTSSRENKTVEMRDDKGNIYDIPSHLKEQARAKGLR